MRRQERINSLLIEVISETIREDVDHPEVGEFTTITRAEVTKDLKYAKVYFSVIGSDEVKQKTLKALKEAAGFIAIQASKKVTLRYFPELQFYLDTSLDKQIRVQELLSQAEEEKKARDARNNSL